MKYSSSLPHVLACVSKSRHRRSGAVAFGNVHEELFPLPRHRGMSQYVRNVSLCSGRIIFRYNDTSGTDQLHCA
jgi:hypothetical protein